MADKTAISWCDSTFNPWIGCTHVSPACDHCYAETLQKRTGGPAWGPGETRRRTSEKNWHQVERWNRMPFAQCNACGWRGEWPRRKGLLQLRATAECGGCGAAAALEVARRRVFCASLADVFDNEVDPAWRRDLIALIARCDRIDWLLLTKRIGNADLMLTEVLVQLVGCKPWPWPHVWLGATIANQEEALRDLPKLLATPAVRRFISVEPMLGPLDLASATRGHALADLSWIIAGGESGPSARPSHPDWFRNLRDQCEDFRVPFLFKQWGEWAPVPDDAGHALELGQRIGMRKVSIDLRHGVRMYRVDRHRSGHAVLDGRRHHEFPASHAPA